MTFALDHQSKTSKDSKTSASNKTSSSSSYRNTSNSYGAELAPDSLTYVLRSIGNNNNHRDSYRHSSSSQRPMSSKDSLDNEHDSARAIN